MANIITLIAEARNEFGKGAARRIRRDNKVPAVLYSGGDEPIHVTLPGHQTMLALRSANALLAIQLPDGTEQLALPKQVHRHPVRDLIMHVDLLKVKRGEKVSVQVPVVLTGEPADLSGVVNHERIEITVRAEATSIPAAIEVSLTDLHIGDHVLVGEIALPEGSQLDDDPEALVVAVNAPVAVVEESAEEDAEDGSEAAEE